MKASVTVLRLLCIGILCHLSCTCFAQADSVYTQVDQAPEYSGGSNEMMRFIMHNLRYPVGARKRGATGSVIITFVVGKDGKLLDPTVLRGADRDLDAEALRVVKAMPPWKPGVENGHPVAVRFHLPIKFVLGLPPTGLRNEVLPPGFPGGYAALEHFIAKNRRTINDPIPPNKWSNKVTVGFEVDSVGTISNIEVEKSLGAAFDREAIRIVSLMPKWLPATINGKPASQKTRAFVDFNTIREKDIQEAFNSYRRGVDLFTRGKDEKALAFFSASLEKNPTSLDTWFNRALVLVRMERTAEACADLKLIKDADAEANAMFVRLCEE